MSPLIAFIVTALIIGLFLWALGQFPIDATILKFIRVLCIVVLAVMGLNLLLVLLFGQGLPHYLGSGTLAR